MSEININGLYTPSMEHDACGIGFIAKLNNNPTNKVVRDAINMLERMEHRGGCGCDPETGDGAGIMVQIPHDFFIKESNKLVFDLPSKGKYGVGMIFMPRDKNLQIEIFEQLNEIILSCDLQLIGKRGVPTNNTSIGETAKSNEPRVIQFFLKHNKDLKPADLERKLYILKKIAQNKIGPSYEDFYICSLSSKTIIYKGQLRTDQLSTYFTDLIDPDFKSAFGMIHSRFSTNTFPKWSLAQPFRYLAHNGEINTIRGNVNKMRAKEALLKSSYFTDEEIKQLLPICKPENSDSANLDEIVELLVMSGRSIAHTLMMLIPEAWQDNKRMNEHKKAFYKYHASIMEPWDGPAAICFTTGDAIGACLDRNGLRPIRYTLTKDDTLIVASESGAHEVEDHQIKNRGRLKPGKMLVADLSKGELKFDEEIKREISIQQPYSSWINEKRTKLRLLPDVPYEPYNFSNEDLLKKQKLFGFTEEDLKVILGPMAETGKEPIGSMGADTPLAVLSKFTQHPANYFKQIFAQVSNPPIDSIRERLVMSLFTRVGSNHNILEETPEHCRQVHITQPVLSQRILEKIKALPKAFNSEIIPINFHEGESLEEGLDKVCIKAEQAVLNDKKILILSDLNIEENNLPIPSLLATGAVQHHLINRGLRARTSIVVESGDAIETHHFATLIGYGASAIHPYMAFETLKNLLGQRKISIPWSEIERNYTKAVGNGLLKIMSKMGISTLQSYQGAQIFEAVGLGPEIIDKCFKGTPSRISGIGFEQFEKEIRHKKKYSLSKNGQLEFGGIYQWKQRGEAHLLNPDTIHLLQKSVKLCDFELFQKYSRRVNEQSSKVITLRSLFDFNKSHSIPIEEVEPVENILKRFATGAMSFGSLSHEAHATLAIAMNRIGAKSNSGEGGEDEIRYQRKMNGDLERSAIKQVASGRFGVTSYYLSEADEIQIKIAQGAKPGEGGQLPGHKVDEWIGRVRNSTPGVGLISPPPHHDIYSIEDLAQLIFDLKNSNKNARVNVKLVSEVGVGTIAAGVAKGFADAILISGADGGTGASPLSSIRHAGLPWEIGLAEAQQTLVKNGLRSRVVLQTDGKILTGRDIAIATLLGAEEWGVSTAALIAEGCIMMRKCHLNTCPVGVATQNPELRKLFSGDPQHVVNLFTFLAEELRSIMAELGFRNVNEMVGQSQNLKVIDKKPLSKLNALKLENILHKEESRHDDTLYNSQKQEHPINDVIDLDLIKRTAESITKNEVCSGFMPIKNTNRAVGTMLSHEISKKYKKDGLPEGTIQYQFKGSAGQSFGAFCTKGIRFILEGDANDYFGKGLCGAQLIIYPPYSTTFNRNKNIIVGNVALFGATSGEAYISGMAGERFCVRNSGAHAVIEGVGDHGCEYMTGGRVLVLGPVGRNFAAGMSGGIAYAFDPAENLCESVNLEMVDLDPIESEDLELIKVMLLKHLKFTGSSVAEELLLDWERYIDKFVKVMPKDFKAVLLAKKESLESSRN